MVSFGAVQSHEGRLEAAWSLGKAVTQLPGWFSRGSFVLFSADAVRVFFSRVNHLIRR